MNRERFFYFIQNPQRLNYDTLYELKDLTEEYPWFQAGWILYLKNLKKVDSPEYKSTLKKAAILVPDRKQLYKFINDEIEFNGLKTAESPAMSYQLSDGGTSEEGDSLIDKFLSSNIGGLNRNGNNSDEQKTGINKELIQKSVEENDELITETLANIYFQQKNYDKALDAYKKLSLKYPEKNIYFATRIEEIEKLKNTN